MIRYPCLPFPGECMAQIGRENKSRFRVVRLGMPRKKPRGLGRAQLGLLAEDGLDDDQWDPGSGGCQSLIQRVSGGFPKGKSSLAAIREAICAKKNRGRCKGRVRVGGGMALVQRTQDQACWRECGRRSTGGLACRSGSTSSKAGATARKTAAGSMGMFSGKYHGFVGGS